MAEKTKKPAAKTAAKPKADAKAKAEVKPKAVAAPKAPRVKKEKTAASTAPSRDSVRKVREGMVVSNKMDKTVVVEIARRTQHPLYGKVVIRSNRFKAHDLLGCDVGDRVEIMETRPISREKRWRVTQILEKVK
jgi:small subunit ribosomal protein S17